MKDALQNGLRRFLPFGHAAWCVAFELWIIMPKNTDWASVLFCLVTVWEVLISCSLTSRS